MGNTVNERKLVLTAIERLKIIAIIRLSQQVVVQPIINAVVEGGIRVLEVTSNTPGYAEEIKMVRKRFPGSIIGCGTVINADIAKKAIDAGAHFLVTPHVMPEIVPLAQKANLPVIMGALTPTEIFRAKSCGADIIKLFPCGTFGTDYVKAVKGPFNDLDVMAVGGINVENAIHWLKAGCMAVGVGGGLLRFDEKNRPDIANIRSTAESFINEIARYHE